MDGDKTMRHLLKADMFSCKLKQRRQHLPWQCPTVKYRWALSSIKTILSYKCSVFRFQLSAKNILTETLLVHTRSNTHKVQTINKSNSVQVVGSQLPHLSAYSHWCWCCLDSLLFGIVCKKQNVSLPLVFLLATHL